MKQVKKYALLSITFLASSSVLYTKAQEAFSPCQTDLPMSLRTLTVHNNFPEAFEEFLFAKTDDENTVKQKEGEIKHITVQVNQTDLDQNKDISVETDKSLQINLIAPMTTMLGLLTTLDVFNRLDGETPNASWWAYTRQTYERCKALALATTAHIYRGMLNLIGDTTPCKVEINISAAKLNEIIKERGLDELEDPKTAIISFHDILDELGKHSERPEGLKCEGSWYNPKIQFI